MKPEKEGETSAPTKTDVKQIKSLVVDVTDRHIGRAVKCSPGKCMITNAVRDAIKAKGLTPAHVATDLQTIRYSIKELGKRFTHLTPKSAFEGLCLFDQGAEVEPFKFKLPHTHAVQVHDLTVSPSARHSIKNAKVSARVAKKGTNKQGEATQGISEKPRVEGGPRIPKMGPHAFSYPAHIRIFGKKMLSAGTAFVETVAAASAEAPAAS